MVIKFPLSIPVKYLALVFFILSISLPAFTQQLNDIPPIQLAPKYIKGKIEKIISRPSIVEICDNNIDDDNNGLTDLKDFSCYFNRTTTGRCVPTKIIWAGGAGKLLWTDLETGTEHYVGDMDNRNIIDIAWAPNGKLYGVENSFIYEIDPYTSATTYVTYVAGLNVVNSMTADAFDNLYLAGFFGNQSSLVKINLTTLQQTLIVSLSDGGVVPGGDLTYYDGSLYLICDNYELARININPINIQVKKLLNSPTSRPFGITNIGDGYLYFSHENKLFKLNPATMVVDGNPAYTFLYPAFGINGLCSYSEFCFSKDCKANVTIDVVSTIPQPYCSEYGVTLSASGNGLSTESIYEWSLPNGNTVAGSTLFVTESGKYKVSYHTVPDTCGKEDSIILSFISGCEKKLFIPTAFTPNGDKLNDIFKPTLFGLTDFYDLQVYNRYGMLVFKTNNPGAGWNGSHQNKNQEIGSYTWVLKYRFRETKIIQQDRGSVLLIR